MGDEGDGRRARFDPANPAGATSFAADIAAAQTIVVGPDGNLWTASADKVLRITPDAVPVVTPFTVAVGARGIAASGDLLWVADFNGAQMLSVTTAGAATPYPTGGGPQEVAGGPGGQVAYGNQGAVPNNLGRLVPGGSPLTTPVPGADPFGVAFAPDGAYWFAQFATNDLGRLTPDGGYTTLGGFSAAAGPRYIANGPGNTLWVALQGVGVEKVARVTGVDPIPPTPPAPPVPPVPPVERLVLSDLSLSRSVFRVGRARTPKAAARRGRRRAARRGTRIRYRLSAAATVRLRFHRRVRGVRVRGKCRRATRRLRMRRRLRRCRRWARAGGLRRKGDAGRNVVRFSGRIGRRALRPGRYRLTAVARDADGLRSRPRRARFRVVR